MRHTQGAELEKGRNAGKVMWFVIFALLPIAGTSYVGWHIWRLLPPGGPLRPAAMLLLFFAVAAMCVNFSGLLERMPLRLAQICYETGTSALFVLLYAAILFLALDAFALARVIPKGFTDGSRAAALAIAALLAAVFVYGNIRYRDKARREIALATRKGGGAKDLKIVMLSDLHLGYHNRRPELARWIDMINAEKPDLVLIAGDIIDISARPLAEEGMAGEFRRLAAPAYACLGNHEYYCGIGLALKFYADAGITLLRDSAAYFGGNVCVIGRDDRSNARRKSLRALMRETDREKYVIVLDHQPFNLEQAEKEGADFQFSGHTHHGQVWPVSWITEAVYEKACGPYRRGGTQYYISSGMGIWGGKFRIGTSSEYIVATLSFGRTARPGGALREDSERPGLRDKNK